jgi:NADPH:quinone reductase-like Zn-dependent oxidoreductase
LISAAVPLAATTALQALTEGCQIKLGDKVLIHNASGGVGSFAVQIAKAYGAYVIGTASKAKEGYVRSLGVDEFIDYRSQRFENVVDNVDAVLAAVGGDDILARSLQVIRKGGHLISLLDDFNINIARQRDINFQRWWVMPNANNLTEVARLIDNGKIKVNIDKVFPLNQIKQAHTLSESQRACGKIVIDVTA